jgi:hypothetical protein
MNEHEFTQYTVGETVNWQRFAKLDNDRPLIEYLLEHRDDDAFDPEANYMAVSHAGRVYQLNLTASIIFDSLVSGMKLADTMAQMTELFEIDQAELKGDVDDIIDEFAKIGLLKSA